MVTPAVKSLFDLCAYTLSRSSNKNTAIYDQSLTNLKTFLAALSGRNEEIRIYVAGTLNMGHQATSILIMNNLIRLGARVIRIIYPDIVQRDNPPTMRGKLIRLIPGLTEEAIQQGEFQFLYKGSSITIYFTALVNSSMLPKITFGVCGGFDETWNASKLLGVRCLLVLQPFRYEKMNAKNILYFNSDDFPAQSEISLPTEFLEKGFYVEDPISPTDYLNTPITNSEEDWKRITVRSVLDQLALQQIEMAPVYFSPGRTLAHPPTILFNLLTGLFAKDTAGTGKPIVLLVMSNFGEEYVVLSRIISGNTRWWIDGPGNKDTQEYYTKEWCPFLCQNMYKYVQTKGYFERFKKVQIISLNDNIKAAISEVGKGGVVIVDLKRVPRLVFDYLYSVGTVPGIFEGEATASLILNLGKPYFHLEASDKDVKPEYRNLYPYPVVPSAKLYPDIVAKYCSGFCFYFTHEAWNIDFTGDPIKIPDQAIARFIKEAYSVGNEYLFSLGGDFTQELDNGQVSAALNQEFQSHNTPLTAQAQVYVDQAGSRWMIIDSSSVYAIRKENQALNVYDNESNLLQIYFKSLRSFFHNEREDKLTNALFIALLEMKKVGLISQEIKP